MKLPTLRRRGRAKRDIDEWFRSSYNDTHVVLPRTLLQAMPNGWQHAFVQLLDEYAAAMDHLPKSGYRVETGEWVPVGECTPTMLADARVRRVDPPKTRAQAMVIVERYMATQGVGWHFTVTSLIDALSETVAPHREWFLKSAIQQLLARGLIERTPRSIEHFRTTSRIEKGPFTVSDTPMPWATFHTRDGRELSRDDVIFVPVPDPTPRHDHGGAQEGGDPE